MLQKEIIFSRLSDKLPPAEEDRSTLLKNVHTEYIIWNILYIVLRPVPFLYGPTIQNFFCFQYRNQKFYTIYKFAYNLILTKCLLTREEKENRARQIYSSSCNA